MIDTPAIDYTPKLRQLERLATVGKLSTSLAHELNQPVTALSLYLDTCIRLLESESVDARTIVAPLAEAKQQVSRAATLIKRLHRFVQFRPPDARPCSVQSLFDTAIGITEPELHRQAIAIHTTIDPPDACVLAESVQIEQVLVNLIRNAAEAIEEQRPADARIGLTARSERGGHIRVSVYDNGPHLSDDDLAQAFDPLYTTKPAGVGLGLFLVRAIVEAHAGTVTIRNHDEGVVVGFTLPSARDA